VDVRCATYVPLGYHHHAVTILILYYIVTLLSTSEKSFQDSTRLFIVSPLAHLELFINLAYTCTEWANKNWKKFCKSVLLCIATCDIECRFQKCARRIILGVEDTSVIHVGILNNKNVN
jgi:hypothetical protein